MSSRYDWKKQAEELSKTLKTLNPIFNQVDFVNSARTISDTLRVIGNLDIVSNAKMLQNTLGTWSSQFEKYKVLQELNVTKIFAAQESVQNVLVGFDFSTVVSRMKIPDYTEGISAALRAYDATRLSSAVQSVFARLDWTNTIRMSELVEEVAEEYIEENELEEEASEEIREVVAAQDGKHLTEKQRRIWEVYIYPFLSSFMISFFFYILSSQPKQPTTIINNTTQVNNYYIVEMGMDTDVLNEYNFRIICENDVMPRIKPDCSLRVVEHLPVGKMVYIVDKYRKWIQITWKNDEGEYCSGWIQNYKVQKFK